MIEQLNIPVPDAIEEISYEAMKSETISYLESVIENAEFLESDPVMLVVEALIYREMKLRARVNHAIRAMFLTTATKGDLDNKAAEHFVFRLEDESDERLRERAFLALDGFSTAGSYGGYVYHTLSVDSSILEAKPRKIAPGVIEVIYHANDQGEELRLKIEEALSGEFVRPMTDTVSVRHATIVGVDLSLDVEVLRMSEVDAIRLEIEQALAALDPKIGEDVTSSKIIKLAFVPGVFRVVPNTNDIIIEDDEIFSMSSLVINFSEVVL
jgi:phage-related baseplate assembly protein